MRAELVALELHRLSWNRVRRAVVRVAREFEVYDLLTYASAIAFQVLYAVVPLALLGLAGLGLLGFESVYTHHIAPTLRHDLSHDAFAIANRTATKVMRRRRLFWLTIGLLLTVWGVAASVRAMMRALNGIYGAEEKRSFLRRLLTSLGVALIVIACVFGAVVAVWGGRLIHPGAWPLAVLVFLARWVVAVALLLVTIATLIRFVPAKPRPVEWVSVGSVLSATSWVVATLAFAAYISAVSYGSFYGALAAVVVLLMYLHVAAIAFLFGVVVDSLLRELVTTRARRRR